MPSEPINPLKILTQKKLPLSEIEVKPKEYYEEMDGPKFERAVLGPTLNFSEAQKRLNDDEARLYEDYLNKKRQDKRYYIKDSDMEKFYAINEKMQRWDAGNPAESSKVIKVSIIKLKNDIAERYPEFKGIKIEYYSAISDDDVTGPLDSKGIDCYFKIGQFRITIDIKAYEEKLVNQVGRVKADIILNKPDIGSYMLNNKDARQQKLEDELIKSLANQVLKKFEEKDAERERRRLIEADRERIAGRFERAKERMKKKLENHP